jgi:hypothetical protein
MIKSKVKTKSLTHTRAHIIDDRDYIPAPRIAKRWTCSTDTANRRLEKFRGVIGFMDLGSHEDVRGNKRKRSKIKIHPDLLVKIEASLRFHRVSPRV